MTQPLEKKTIPPLVILDRDGVINYDSPNYIKSEEEWRPIPGSLEAIARLNAHGFIVIVATNQSGIARGLYDLAMLERIHQKMHRALAAVGGKIDKIFFCPHGPEDHCLCRKPLPGLFHQIAKAYNIDFFEISIPAVGDSLRDLQAAAVAGCRPMLTLTGNGEKTALKLKTMQQDKEVPLNQVEIFKDLSEAVNALLTR